MWTWLSGRRIECQCSNRGSRSVGGSKTWISKFPTQQQVVYLVNNKHIFSIHYPLSYLGSDGSAYCHLVVVDRRHIQQSVSTVESDSHYLFCQVFYLPTVDSVILVRYKNVKCISWFAYLLYLFTLNVPSPKAGMDLPLFSLIVGIVDATARQNHWLILSDVIIISLERRWHK